MKLITLTEYCMFIFFAGVYLAVTGFTARDLGLYIGIALIYTFVHIYAKRMLTKRGKETAEIRMLFSVLLIMAAVFVTVLFIAVLASLLS
ncbi:hypothetical protein P9D34_18110 [Bacillus swezeyi]|uniref:Uncharacterized protein n=1 Tax=Bacillus swezeyi TaxID=1925020 RepID=A0A1R1QKE5_9BACI|nr:hypothetical protein [Bacillus swezeyi]KAA6453034.1 hypothetical protein DX927_02120 [Bacillus swezeyi]KAA6476346.1 hypothetical protein DX928_09805 [Bacillus swezeyi]MEC1262297.1 hypothetical protein [Bacillus swezeyi]MED2926994.1 hypothetical protein [Bacillus swezeyi]MED2943227.1 hypothetical protein [Bacillus swezeyi]